jgi:hypothetical protein
VAARFEFVVDGVGHVGLDRKLIEARRVRPERPVEVTGLHTGPFEGGVQVRVPVVPEIDHAQEGLEDGLVLIIAAGRAEGHDRHIAAENHAGCERVAWAGVRADLVGPGLIQPELFAAHAHADAGVAQDHGAGNPAATGGGVEEIAVLIDNGHVGSVLRYAGGVAA